MEEKHHRVIQDARRLAELVAQERAESIRQQLSAANTVLGLANTEFEQGRVQQANRLMEKMRHVAEEVRTHLGEPHHVPSADAEELHTALKQMESRISALANRLNT